VKIRQVARAISGDVMAGQSIALAAPGPRCHNFLVRARNVLQDVEVRSGNATAANHSTILLDPGIDPRRLDLRLHQHAIAEAGQVTTGQVIGAVAGGGRAGCGNVTIDASNFQDEVSVRSGKAVGTNDNTIKTCAEAGCAAELRALVPQSDVVQMCNSGGCDTQSGTDVAATLPPGPSLTPDPTPDLGLTGTSTVVPEPTHCPRHGRRARLCRAAAAAATPSPSPTPSPTPSGTPVATTTPSPTPTPTPTGAPIR
jgi:hypothetical protein